jgi:hypothetical protein
VTGGAGGYLRGFFGGRAMPQLGNNFATFLLRARYLISPAVTMARRSLLPLLKF